MEPERIRIEQERAEAVEGIATRSKADTDRLRGHAFSVHWRPVAKTRKQTPAIERRN